jgi:hypothetical protein
MTYTFVNNLPDYIHTDPVLISGKDSLQFHEKEFLLLHQNDGLGALYEIRYEQHCSPFKQVIVSDHILAVGHEEYFYLFDQPSCKNLLRLKLSGYFGHLYTNNNHFYVSDANGITCINQQGKICWNNNGLGVDGIIINSFTGDCILGAGEWDPPGGWKDFMLEKNTGNAVVK